MSRWAAAVAGALALAAAATATLAQTSAADAAHIAHIEAGLAPAHVAAGAPLTRTPLAQRMAALHVPGVSIAYIHDGRIAWARGFGVTRIDGPPVSETTLFEAGSLRGALTATLAINLSQFGRVDLDGDVGRYLKSRKAPFGPLGEAHTITLRWMLRNAGDDAVVRRLLEDATGQPFVQLMRGIVLEPLDMERSMFEGPVSGSPPAEAATPYGMDGTPVLGGGPDEGGPRFWTTPSDLARWVIALQRALAGRSNYLLFPESAREMLTDAAGGRRGLGVELGGSPASFGQIGFAPGFRSLIAAFDDGDGAVIMTSGDGGGELTQDILATIASEYDWPGFQRGGP